MKQPGRRREQAFVPDHEAPEVAEPGEGALHDPAAFVAPQLAPILMSRVVVPARGGNDWGDLPTREAGGRL